MAEIQAATKVLIAVDDSAQAEFAVTFYLQHFHKPDNSVIVLHTIELPELHNAKVNSISPATLADMWEKEIAKSKETERRYSELMKEHGVENITLLITQGTKPGEKICEVAQKEGVNMILLGTRGMGTIRRTILGSVSDYVVHHAHVPVLVARK